MKQKNRMTFALVMLCIALILPLFAAPAAAFGDISKRHWAFDIATFAEETQSMNGVGENRFDPDGLVTRAALVTILARFSQEEQPQYQNLFSDVDATMWYASAVQWATENQIISSDEDGMFHPEQAVTREELMLAFFRYAKARGEKDTVNIDWSVLERFSDSSQLNPWAMEAAAWCVQNNLISGSGTGAVLSPVATTSRIQLAKLLQVYQLGAVNPYTPVAPIPGQRTLRNYINTALEPVGSCMYIWGGGWEGKDQNRIGVNPNWKAFADKQTADYHYADYDHKYGYGLDCSGFVGWVTYNVLNSKSGKTPYVMMSKTMAATFAKRGFGTYTDKAYVTEHKPGDVMSSTCADGCRHVWISLGECSDGSVVLVHSSPNGVRIAGTIFAELPEEYTGPLPEEYKTEAVRLAEYYMSQYYATWYARYPNCYAIADYNSHYSSLSWNLGAGGVLSDPDGVVNQTPNQILADLIGA